MNPYAKELEDLLSKVTEPGKVGEGQRRGIRRAIRAVNKVWREQELERARA